MLNCCDKGSIFRSKTIQSIMDQINIFDTFIYSTKRVGYRFDPMKINVNGVNPFMSTLKFFENVWFSSCGLLLVELFKCSHASFSVLSPSSWEDSDSVSVVLIQASTKWSDFLHLLYSGFGWVLSENIVFRRGWYRPVNKAADQLSADKDGF